MCVVLCDLVIVFAGEKLILDVIQQVMAARAIHNMFKTTESHLVVSSSFIRYDRVPSSRLQLVHQVRQSPI